MSQGSYKNGQGRGRRQAGGLGESLPIKVAGLWADIKTLLAMLYDFLVGRYRSVPFKTLAAIVVAILYVISPIDLLPDFIPFVGYLDDAFVIVLAIDLVRDDLETYRIWRKGARDGR
jgi:uncharacterized membrane protein YkvA (DUF1232 family)